MYFPIHNGTQKEITNDLVNDNSENQSPIKKSFNKISEQRKLNFKIDLDEITEDIHFSPFANNESPKKRNIISPRTINNDSIKYHSISPGSPRFEKIILSSSDSSQDSLSKEDIFILKRIENKLERINKKVRKQANKVFLQNYNAAMLDVYQTGLFDSGYQHSHLYKSLDPEQRSVVDRDLKKNPSLKKYIEHSSCLTFKALEALTSLGSDYPRHINFVSFYNPDGQTLLTPLNPDVKICTSAQLQRFRKWLVNFCTYCSINHELKTNLLEKWDDCKNKNKNYIDYENNVDAACATVQMFFNLLLSNEEWEGISEEKRASLRVVASCMATISQKLYSTASLSVGKVTRPNKMHSVYKDIQGQKAIRISFDDRDCINVQVSTTKEVNRRETIPDDESKVVDIWSQEESDYKTFPNVRLILTNTLRSKRMTMDEWESNFSIKLGIERIDRTGNEALQKKYDKKGIITKVIKPLADFGLTIDEVFLY